MPLNESKRKTRERWPLAFDLEGIPRDTATRTQLLQSRQILEALEQEQSMPPVKNSFATDFQQENVVDINDPRVPQYGTVKNPFREFPKMVYHHETGHVLTVLNPQQYAAAERRGFEDKPSLHRDYSKVKSGMVAPVAIKGPEREHVMTIEEIEAEEAAQLAELSAEAAPVQSQEEADAEIAAALGEVGDAAGGNVENGDAGSRRRKR